jgi:4-diphosphocytidyl-2-C-methyl-D-erythritol kinase
MLHIVGRRQDGYHNLQTVFQFVDRCDWIWFTPRRDGAIKRTGSVEDVPAETDLTIRAAYLLKQTMQSCDGITVHIVKKLPLGSGLGGGSSDAATTLVALNHFWRTGLTLLELADLGLLLGADVPVFILGRASWAEGIGERLTPVDLDEPWFLVLEPNCQITTKSIFNDMQLTRCSPPIKMCDFLDGYRGNDCEEFVYRRYPEVADAAAWLAQYGQVHLTGTGACVFAEFSDEESAKQILKKLPSKWTGFVARGCNYSPLQKRLVQEQAHFY